MEWSRLYTTIKSFIQVPIFSNIHRKFSRYLMECMNIIICLVIIRIYPFPLIILQLLTGDTGILLSWNWVDMDICY